MRSARFSNVVRIGMIVTWTPETGSPEISVKGATARKGEVW
jgi:hypothetical protein